MGDSASGAEGVLEKGSRPIITAEHLEVSMSNTRSSITVEESQRLDLMYVLFALYRYFVVLTLNSETKVMYANAIPSFFISYKEFVGDRTGEMSNGTGSHELGQRTTLA